VAHDPDIEARINRLISGPIGRSLLVSLAGYFLPSFTRMLRSASTQVIGRDEPAASEQSMMVAAEKSIADSKQNLDCLATFSDDAALAMLLGRQADAWIFNRIELDAVSALEIVGTALRPVAEALVASPASSWWWHAFDSERQVAICSPLGKSPPRGSDVTRYSRLAMQSVMKYRPRLSDAFSPATGIWSSVPRSREALRTCLNPPNQLPPTDVFLGEDPLDGGFTVWSCVLVPEARVYEINTPGDWKNLVENYSMVESVGYRPDFERVSGITGPWVIPNWLAVAEEWDALYVSIEGFLSSNGLVQEVSSGYSMLSGSIPCEVSWFRDQLCEVSQMWESISGNGGGPDSLLADELPWMAR